MRGRKALRRLQPFSVVLLLGGLACSRPGLPETSPATRPDVPVLILDSAIVRRTEAVFVVPVDPRPEWRWHLTQTPADLREYRWEFQITSAGRLFQFGYSLFRRADRPTRSGSLAALIAAGQRSLWYEQPDSMWVVVSTRAIQAEARGEDRVVIRVQGEAAVTDVFQDRPAQIRLLVLVPGSAEQTYTVPLTYVASDGSP